MNHKLSKYLCCPKCKLKFCNNFYCKYCKIKYKVIEGIPVLINASKLTNQIFKQTKYFENESVLKIKYVFENWQLKYVNIFKKYLKFNSNTVIVDNGTGSGYMAIELAKMGFNVIATDITFAELFKLKKILVKLKLVDRVLPICCLSEDLPIISNSIHGLVANAVLEHIENDKNAVIEIKRVLKNKSPLMVTTPLSYKYIWPFFWLINYIHDKRIGHLRRYDDGMLINLFTGFDKIQIFYTGHLLKVFGVIINRIFNLKTIDDWIEKIDILSCNIKYGASNIIIIFIKKINT
jgi:ubiquinone/menaquinone biosynthesis C-methylase UbiE/uncharacterized protein YbaR (Trm112 family)